MLKRQMLSVIAITATLLGGSAAFANGDPSGRWAEREQKFQAACSQDVEKLCPGTQAGKAQRKCIFKAQEPLSETCEALVTRAKQRMAQWKANHEQGRQPASN
jgi:hypothetical protein